MTLDPAAVARLLRQRAEMGLPPLVLEGGTRQELLDGLAAMS